MSAVGSYFVYARAFRSFFEKWWNEIGEDRRKAVRSLVDKHQFEFVEGRRHLLPGFFFDDGQQADGSNLTKLVLLRKPSLIRSVGIAPDRRGDHSQITEGHEFLVKNFGYRPRSALA